MNKYYCLNCHEFTKYNLEGEGNGNAGYYCLNCGMKVYSKCSETVLKDLKNIILNILLYMKLVYLMIL